MADTHTLTSEMIDDLCERIATRLRKRGDDLLTTVAICAAVRKTLEKLVVIDPTINDVP